MRAARMLDDWARDGPCVDAAREFEARDPVAVFGACRPFLERRTSGSATASAGESVSTRSNCRSTVALSVGGASLAYDGQRHPARLRRERHAKRGAGVTKLMSCPRRCGGPARRSRNFRTLAARASSATDHMRPRELPT
jgi:hypothetical protein